MVSTRASKPTREARVLPLLELAADGHRFAHAFHLRGERGSACGMVAGASTNALSVDEFVGAVSQGRPSSPVRLGCQPWADGIESRLDSRRQSMRDYSASKSIWPSNSRIDFVSSPFPHSRCSNASNARTTLSLISVKHSLELISRVGSK